MFEQDPRREISPVQTMDEGVAEMAAASSKLLAAIPGFDDESLWELDGATSMSSWLAARYGVAWAPALERRAEEVVLEDGPLYDRHGARLADALVELVCSGEGGGTAPVLVVHSDASVLTPVCDRGEPRIAETDSGVALAEESIRRLA